MKDSDITNVDPPLQTWDEVFEWRHLKTTGLLWLINRVVFHPRGYALGIVPGAGEEDREYYGWTLQGDGTEPWTFPVDVEDGHFADVEAFLQAVSERGFKAVAGELRSTTP